MNNNDRQLIHAIVNKNLKYARTCVKEILKSSKTEKDKNFCASMLQKMEEQELEENRVPMNLRNMIRTDSGNWNFLEERYFLTKREAEILQKLIQMYSVSTRMSERKLRCSSTLLLYGQSGTGKTTFAQYIAAKLGLPFYYINLTQMIDSYLGKTSQNMELIFNFVAEEPCVVMFDEIDAIGTRRGEDRGVGGELKRVLISLMENLDKLPNHTILIAATNRYDSLDEALIRRFRARHEVASLSRAESISMIQFYMGKVDLPFLGDLNMFLDNEVKLQLTGNSTEDHFTPAAILDCLNNKIASAFFASDSDNPTVILN